MSRITTGFGCRGPSTTELARPGEASGLDVLEIGILSEMEDTHGTGTDKF
jgi:hypothetical protein